MHVIALYGTGSCGKSYTLNALYMHMLTNGYVQVPGHFQNFGGNYDFLDILSLDGNALIGIVSRGDEGPLLVTDLNTLHLAGCTKVICATRTRGATVTAVNAYTHTWVQKTVAGTSSQERLANHQDVMAIFPLI